MKDDKTLEAQKRALDAWTKPLAMPRPVPKSQPKKRGRPAKEVNNEE